MNPLSVWTYYRRHKARALLLVTLVAVGTMGLYMVGGLMRSTFISPERTVSLYLENFSVVVPRSGNALPSTVVSQIRTNHDIASVHQQTELEIDLPGLAGNQFTFDLIGLLEESVPVIMEQSDVTLLAGRMISPRRNEVMLSEQVAQALEVGLGDQISRFEDADLFGDVLEPLEIVGILSGDVRLGIMSYEYLDSHEFYRDNIRYGLIVIPQAGRAEAVDTYLQETFDENVVRTFSLSALNKKMAEQDRTAYLFGGPLSILVAIVLTIVIGAINQIAFTQRLPEFGILHATGYSKQHLTKQLIKETVAIVALGWLVGLVLGLVVFLLVGQLLFTSRGHDFQVLQPLVLLFLIPVPLLICAVTLTTIIRTFKKLDAVAIVERGGLDLSNNTKKSWFPSRPARSSSNPLSSAIYNKRHRRRASLVIATTASMIAAVVLFIFLFSTSQDAAQVALEDIRQMDVLIPNSRNLSASEVSQIKSQSFTERIITTKSLRAVAVNIPPFSDVDTRTYAVSAEDMAYLVNLYNLKLEVGSLPQPRTNEIVISSVVAQNRGLVPGDVIGSADTPLYDDAPILPVPFVVSGIFAVPGDNENWLSFASLEFMNSHELYRDEADIFLVTATSGSKASLDSWLKTTFMSSARVITYDDQLSSYQEQNRSTLFTVALIQGIVALIAAASLATLSYLFVIQRQSEFGVLNAIGHGRRKLVLRTIKESIFTTTTAWIVSLVICLSGLAYLQIGVFRPLGVSLQFLNLLPWLFTLPVPIIIIVVNVGTIVRVLDKLDPVGIIERR